MDRATFVFKLVEEIAKNFFSALPRMEAVCEVGLKLEAEEEDVGVLLSLLHYTTIITFSCVFFTLGRRKWLQPGVEAAKTASVFDVLRRFCSLLLEDGLEPTFYSENFCPTRLPPILEAVWKKVDLCHEVSMCQFSYFLYDKLFSHSPLRIPANLHCSELFITIVV